MSRELLKRAAVVLREVWDNDDCYCAPSVIELQKEIVAYLAQPEPEPVAWMTIDRDEHKRCQMVRLKQSTLDDYGLEQYPLYTTPPDQSERIAELEKDNDIAHENLAWYTEKYYEHLAI